MSFRSSAPVIPLSPASSPDQGVKHQTKPFTLDFPSASPRSPASMSVATKRYVPTYTNGGHTNEMANRSPDSFIAQAQRQPLNSTTTQLQPVTQQSNMLKRPAPQDGDEKPNPKRQRQENIDDSMEVETFTPTNHDRQDAAQSNGVSQPTVSFSDDVQAREITGASKVDSDPIFKDVGPAFRIGKSTHNRAGIDISQHLLGKYGLHPLLSQVARFDPQTDEKINKLRKSYEGQIKIAKFPGKTGAHNSKRDIANGEPSNLVKWALEPEDKFTAARTDRKIGDFSGFEDILKAGLHINHGSMPEKTRNQWEEVLGLEAYKAPPRTNGQIVSQPPSQPQMNGIRHVPHPSDSLNDRATRKKKRSYLDNSFSGYESGGVSDPDGDHDRDYDYADGQGKRRRRF